jgi:hypothetical protein
MHNPTVRVGGCKTNNMLVGLCIRIVAVRVQQVWIELQYVKAQNLLPKNEEGCM